MTAPARAATGARAQRRPSWSALDGAGLLTIYLVLLFLVPARLVAPGLGAAGRPAVIFGIGLLFLWVVTRMLPEQVLPGRQPVRWALAVFLVFFLIAYGLGAARGLPGPEARGADRALIVQLSLIGVTLVACDGISSRDRLDAVLRRLVLLGTLMGLVGALQFFTGFNLASRIRVPGLRLNAPIVDIGSRGGPDFARVAGTASHYIEYGVVLAMLLPIAIHLLLHARTPGQRQLWTFCSLVIGASIPLSVSRAGTLALVLGLLLLGLAWEPGVQRRSAVIVVGATVVFQGVVPGLLGTIRSAFTNFNNDPSIQNRRSDYAEIVGYVQDRPWFGRGPGTFTPERYLLLDNQALLTTLEIGLLGALALLLLLVVAALCARSVRHRAARPSSRHLGAVLAVGLVQGLVSALTFDALFFPIFAGLLFLYIGLCGALYRLRDEPAAFPEPVRLRPTLADRGSASALWAAPTWSRSAAHR